MNATIEFRHLLFVAGHLFSKARSVTEMRRVVHFMTEGRIIRTREFSPSSGSTRLLVASHLHAAIGEICGGPLSRENLLIRALCMGIATIRNDFRAWNLVATPPPDEGCAASFSVLDLAAAIWMSSETHCPGILTDALRADWAPPRLVPFLTFEIGIFHVRMYEARVGKELTHPIVSFD